MKATRASERLVPWRHSIMLLAGVAFALILLLNLFGALLGFRSSRSERALYEQIEQAQEARTKSLEVQGHFLSARQQENSFLARWRIEGYARAYGNYAAANQQHILASQRVLSQLEAHLQAAPLAEGAPLSALVTRLRPLLAEYQTVVRLTFSQVAERSRAGGLEEALAGTARALESAAAAEPTLQTEFFRLEATAQSYFANPQQGTVDRFRLLSLDVQQALEARSDVRATTTLPLLRQYRRDFLALAALDQQLRSASLRSDLITQEVSAVTEALLAASLQSEAQGHRRLAAQSERNTRMVALAGAIIFLLTILLMVWLSRRLLRPLGALSRGAQSVAAGDLNHSVVIPTQDEFGALAATFNQMVRQLRGVVTELEQRVAQRTRAVAESEARYRLLLDQTPLPIVVFSVGGQPELVNSAFTEHFGWTLDEFRREEQSRFVPLELQEELALLLKNQRLTPTGSTIETQRYTRDGRLRAVSRRSAYFTDASGAVAGAVVIFQDVTERKLAEAALHRAMEAAEAANRTKSEFLATMSHELRTPLAVMIGYAEMLHEEAELDGASPSAMKPIQRIIVSGRHLLSMIGDILDFARLEAGRIELEIKPLDLPALLEEVRTLFEQSAQQKGLALHLHLADSLPTDVEGDATRLRQVLLNVIGNAIKFTEQGHVTIRVTGVPPAGAAVPFTLHVAVSDSGIGIPAEQFERLFQPFSQVDASTTRRFGGSGLGLVVSQRLVQRMGGELWAESCVGEGSTFHITLPLSLVTPPPLPPGMASGG